MEKTQTLALLCFLISLYYFARKSFTLIDKIKIIAVVSTVSIGCFVGARYLHALIERPDLLDNPSALWDRFDGLTFNGSLILGTLLFYLLLFMFTKKQRAIYWDTAGLATPFIYGVLRIGCFIHGCCWGKPTSVPWAVKYYESDVMPWHGIPVHPVQLYDAALGFFIFFLLYRNRKSEQHQGYLYLHFLMYYSIGRFFTEFYRGDSFRGENIWLHLSTSQIVSITTLLICFFILYLKKRRGSYV